MGAKHGTPRERFERFVSPEPTSGCHLWMYAAGQSIRSLARQFGITHEPARAIVHGRTWKHLLTGGCHRVHE